MCGADEQLICFKIGMALANDNPEINPDDFQSFRQFDDYLRERYSLSIPVGSPLSNVYCEIMNAIDRRKHPPA